MIEAQALQLNVRPVLKLFILIFDNQISLLHFEINYIGKKCCKTKSRDNYSNSLVFKIVKFLEKAITSWKCNKYTLYWSFLL